MSKKNRYSYKEMMSEDENWEEDDYSRKKEVPTYVKGHKKRDGSSKPKQGKRRSY